MTHIEINPERFKRVLVDLIAGSLKIGQVAVLPTDTIYGLSCLATDVRAIKKIYRLKKRDKKKPLLILVSSLKMARKYVAISREQGKALLKAGLPGSRPTTFIFKNLYALPKELALEADGLAVRLPKSKFLIKIIKKVDAPLVSTSLNLSGEKNITNLKKLKEYFPRKDRRPELVIDCGRAKTVKPSRLIDWRDNRRPVVIRK